MPDGGDDLTSATDETVAASAATGATPPQAASAPVTTATTVAGGPIRFELTPERRRKLTWLAVVPVVFLVSGSVGQLLLATLVDRAPVALLTLNATDAVLLLVAEQMPALVFLLLGAARLYVTDPFLYELGRELGPDARNYVAASLGSRSRIVRTFDWMQQRLSNNVAGWLVLFALPGYPMCLLAGVARFHRLWFNVVNVLGTLSRLAVILWLANWFNGPIGEVVQFVSRYWLPVTVAMVVLVMLQTNRGQRSASPR